MEVGSGYRSKRTSSRAESVERPARRSSRAGSPAPREEEARHPPRRRRREEDDDDEEKEEENYRRERRSARSSRSEPSHRAREDVDPRRASPGPADRSRLSDLMADASVIPLHERKSSLSNWDAVPPGYEGMSAAEAKATGTCASSAFSFLDLLGSPLPHQP